MPPNAALTPKNHQALVHYRKASDARPPTNAKMCDKAMDAVTGSRSSVHGSSARAENDRYSVHGYDRNGNKWKQNRQKPTYNSMKQYASESEGEGSYNRPQSREHNSPFSRSSAAPADEGYEYENYAGGQADQYDVNEAQHVGRDAGARAGPSSAPVAVPSVDSFDIMTERGMSVDFSVPFSGSPFHFANGNAPIAPTADDARTPASGVVFTPTMFHFNKDTFPQILRAPQRMNGVKAAGAKAIARMTAEQQHVLPLSVAVEEYHNPFSFSVGLRSTHPPLNTISAGRSGQNYMAVLLPGTNQSKRVVDLRENIKVGGIIATASVANEDILRQCKPSGRRAPGVVMVEKDSALYATISAFSKKGKVEPIDLDALPVNTSQGGSFVDGVPKKAADYAIEYLQNIKSSKNGKIPVEAMGFSIHPLNYEERWDGHHMSGAGFDWKNNKQVYEDFMNRPVDLVVNMRMEYL